MRPFGKVPSPVHVPRSLFVTAIDTNPHAPDVSKTLQGRENDFANGLTVLSLLSKGKVYLCLPQETDLAVPENERVEPVLFSGPHPAGNPGTHIHLLDPVGKEKQAWYIDAQDTAAIGALFTTGRINFQRIISLAGPSVSRPRLLRTRLGADLQELVAGETSGDVTRNRLISGSVLSGTRVQEPVAFLGRYHQQVSILPEDGSIPRLHRIRAIVPIGRYERVMPLDILPTFLFRALAVHDVEDAEKLGCLELVEEDLALCSYVCPSGMDHGANLRNTLEIIEKEG
jgi:Na+-transporting NADH:ubiquinone oxidoreductase subunit A